MSNTPTPTFQISFLGLLAILFIGLKLTGNITWSWWWVLSPIWIPWGIVLVIFSIFAIVMYIKGG